ncbi:hypothetical protein HDU99_009266 [Rhizoclosmatium hyalinum]|nr:hypothetical protein HDU99_009266 [Rhizoclosmatium hyalinum]
MQGIQQPLLPGPVMGLMLSGHMGSPMMRRSTSASSAGSMAGDRNISTPSASGVSIFGSNATVPPGSPRVGVVFGGGANVVVASPRGSMHVASGGGAVTPNANTSGGSQFGQLLNMGGAQDHLSKMSLS